jgi:hypothetical protein
MVFMVDGAHGCRWSWLTVFTIDGAHDVHVVDVHECRSWTNQVFAFGSTSEHLGIHFWADVQCMSNA